MVILHKTKNVDQKDYNCASNLPKGRMFEVCSCHCSKPTKVGVQWAMMVIIAERFHLFPFRTQKLSSYASTIFGWRRPEKIDRCHQPDVANSTYATCDFFYQIANVDLQCFCDIVCGGKLTFPRIAPPLKADDWNRD